MSPRPIAIHIILILSLIAPSIGHCTEQPPVRPSSTDSNEVLIGYFGPTDPCNCETYDMWRAASLAVEKANRTAPQAPTAFRLVPRWSDNPWTSGAKHVVQMAYTDKVCAVIGGIDGPSTHLAEQVITKAQLTLLSPASTDRTANLVNIPWMFSILTPDTLQTPVLAREIKDTIGDKPFLIASAIDHDSHLFALELTKSLSKLQLVPANHFDFPPNQPDFHDLTKRILDADPTALVVIAAANPGANLTSALRKKGYRGLIFGGPTMGQRDFLKTAADAAEGVIFPLLYLPAEPADEFVRTFTTRFGHPPDYLAAHTYDAVNLLAEAVHRAGNDRLAIQNEVRRISPYRGATGLIEWDSRQGNSRRAALGKIVSGRIQKLHQSESSTSP